MSSWSIVSCLSVRHIPHARCENAFALSVMNSSMDFLCRPSLPTFHLDQLSTLATFMHGCQKLLMAPLLQLPQMMWAVLGLHPAG